MLFGQFGASQGASCWMKGVSSVLCICTHGERKTARERERCSHFGSSAAPLLGGLCRLLASGGRCEVDPRLSTLGEPSHLSQRCLSSHTCCRFAPGTLAGLGTIEPYSRRASLKLYLLGCDLASARASPTALCRRRGRRSSPSAPLPPLPQRPQRTSLLGGGVSRPSDRDCGKDGEIVKFANA